MKNIIIHNIDSTTFRDQRGWVANPFSIPGFPQQFGHLHTVSMNPGTKRGNHRHKTCREWFFVFGGAYSVRWKNDKGIQEKRFSDQQMRVVEVPPGVEHAIINTADHTIYLIAFQEGSREKISKDTVPTELPEP